MAKQRNGKVVPAKLRRLEEKGSFLTKVHSLTIFPAKDEEKTPMLYFKLRVQDGGNTYVPLVFWLLSWKKEEDGSIATDPKTGKPEINEVLSNARQQDWCDVAATLLGQPGEPVNFYFDEATGYLPESSHQEGDEDGFYVLDDLLGLELVVDVIRDADSGQCIVKENSWRQPSKADKYDHKVVAC